MNDAALAPETGMRVGTATHDYGSQGYIRPVKNLIPV
jgi:hypothetical protein